MTNNEKQAKEKALYTLYQPASDNCAAGCMFALRYYKAKGALYYKNPKAGDQIFFGSSDSKVTHTGLVIAVNGNKVTTIEGNKSNMVKQCTYDLSAKSSKVWAFGRPRYNNDDFKNAVIEYSKSQKGYKETGTNHNKYAATLDAINYFNTKKQNCEWCGVFVCACVYTTALEMIKKANQQPAPAPAPEPEPITPAPDPTPAPKPQQPASKPGQISPAPATTFKKSDAGTYRVTAKSLRVRKSAGTDAAILTTVRAGEKVRCYGYSRTAGGQKWLCVVTIGGVTGYCCSAYLHKY